MFFHHSGHTHRNKRTFLLDGGQNPIPSPEFLEVGATKEYPGGYALLRLFTGGYMVSYYKNRTPLALAWSRSEALPAPTRRRTARGALAAS